MYKIITALLISLFLAGCTINPHTGEKQTAKSVKYGGIATATGAVVGALIGGKKGAVIGAGLGAMTGGSYGFYTDYQENKLRKELEQARMTVTRNQDQTLTVTMPDITFQTNSAMIDSQFFQALTTISNTVKEKNGLVRIVGHTDNRGSIELNQALSLARANSVANYLSSQGIPFSNISTQGMAYYNPIADNETEFGRAKNRRVEIILQ